MSPREKYLALPFPQVSKKWYSSITDSKPDGYKEDNVSIENLVFPRVSKGWYKRRSKLSSKNKNKKLYMPADGYIQKNVADLERSKPKFKREIPDNS